MKERVRALSDRNTRYVEVSSNKIASTKISSDLVYVSRYQRAQLGHLEITNNHFHLDAQTFPIILPQTERLVLQRRCLGLSLSRGSGAGIFMPFMILDATPWCKGIENCATEETVGGIQISDIEGRSLSQDTADFGFV